MQVKTIMIIVLVMVSTIASALPKDDRKRSDEEQIAQPAPIEGQIYALPRKGLVVHVSVIEKKFIPGPYYQYAEKYLGIKNAKGNAQTSWSISKIGIDEFTEADPDAMFKVQDSIPVMISTLPDGVIAGINKAVEGCFGDLSGEDFLVEELDNGNDFTDLSSNDFYELIVDSESGSETMRIKTLEEKAREAADYIIRLRKKRSYEILSPSDVIPEDGTGYAVFVAEAEKIDRKYTALFTGKTKQKEHQFSFIFIPGNENSKNEVLFRMSEDKGVLPKTDLSGKPIFVNVTKSSKAFNSILSLKDNGNDTSEKGIFYRMPVSADVEITDGLKKLYHGRTTFPQMGVVVPVAENLLNTDYQIEYNTKTGSLKSIEEMK